MSHKVMYLRFQIINEFRNQRNPVSKKAGIYKLRNLINTVYMKCVIYETRFRLSFNEGFTMCIK